MKKSIFNSQKGFTLIEMIIAVALFALIATFSLGSIVSIFDANRNARASKTVVDNLNLSLENMVRTIRFGTNYYCGESSNQSQSGDCLSASGESSFSVTFKDPTNGVTKRIIYKLDTATSRIRMSENGGSSYTDITSSDTKIQDIKFHVLGTDASPDTVQPYVLVVIRGYVSSKPTVQSAFSVETLISQRKPDYE
jgi:prepilin-type N-terminal cleavage/methylation domain-containing protein